MTGASRLSAWNLLPAAAGRAAAALLAALGPPRGRCPLGAEIAVSGPRARRVFAASRRMAKGPGPGVDLVVADAPGAARGLGVPVVALSQASPLLAVPAVDPAVDNPAGWLRHGGRKAGTLGPPALLPDGIRARRISRGNRRALGRVHHVEDMAAHHAEPVARAGTLVRLAARGVPVHLADADADERLAPLLGEELWGLMNAGMRDLGPGAREHLSVRMRRAALREHSLRARARQFCEAALPDPPQLPLVSVLLPSRRAAHLPHAVGSVAGQSYPRIELVLVLHGEEGTDVEGGLSRFPHPAKVVRVGTERPFGTALNAGAREASGAFVARMDDDDVYHPDHLWDLALAMDYARADIVGKEAEFIYLAKPGRTVHRFQGTGERRALHVGGGCLMVTRAALERVGGWRRIPGKVDLELCRDIVRSGGWIYRTSGSGFLRIRHGGDHVWATTDSEILAQSDSVRFGWNPAFAGMASGLERPWFAS